MMRKNGFCAEWLLLCTAQNKWGRDRLIFMTKSLKANGSNHLHLWSATDINPVQGRRHGKTLAVFQKDKVGNCSSQFTIVPL